MKKTLSLLLALLMLFSLAACGGNGSDKSKLIGRFYSHDEYLNYTTYFTLFNAVKRNIVFFPNDTFYYSEESTLSGVGEESGTEASLDPVKSGGSGKYTIENGFILLSDFSGDIELPEDLRDPIPYYIQEDTQKLVFGAASGESSQWNKKSDTPTIPE